MKDVDALPKLWIRGQIAPKDSFLASMAGETFSASDLVKFLEEHRDDPSIAVHISSDGGYRSEGVEMYSLLKNCGKEVITIAEKANSIATVLMLGGTTRLIAEYAPFTVHFARIDPVNLGTEALTAADLQRLSDETERADQQILNIYCSELGEDKRMELTAAMAAETDLGARGAIKLGFATGYYKKKKKITAAVEDYVGLALTDGIAALIQNNMEKTALDKFSEKIENALKNISRRISGIKNELTLPVSGGAPIYAIPVDPTKPENLKDAKVYTLDEAGMPTETPVADGEVTLEDGRVLVIAGGVVSEVRDAVDTEKVKADLATATQENIDLKAKVEAQAAEITALKGDKVEMKKTVDLIKNEFEAFKKQVPADPAAKPEAPVVKKDFSKMSRVERLLEMRKESTKIQ